MALAGAGLLSGCAPTGLASTGVHAPGWSRDTSSMRIADARMIAAPHDRASWLRAVDRTYASAAGGHSAEQWLRRRMAHRRPGERLAVIMGIDDVMVQTHFAGIHALVPRSVAFVRTAHALGYSVIYVTGRSYAHGLSGIEAVFGREGVPANAFYGRPSGALDEAAAKAQCRASIQAQGYTLAVSVAADGASFVGAPRAEHEIRLPDFGLRA